MTWRELRIAMHGTPDDAVIMVPDLAQGLGLVELTDVLYDNDDNEVHLT